MMADMDRPIVNDQGVEITNRVSRARHVGTGPHTDAGDARLEALTEEASRRRVAAELGIDPDLWPDGFLRLEGGTLDMAVFYSLPPRWKRILFPSARRRARETRASKQRLFDEMAETFSTTVKVVPLTPAQRAGAPAKGEPGDIRAWIDAGKPQWWHENPPEPTAHDDTNPCGRCCWPDDCADGCIKPPGYTDHDWSPPEPAA